MAISCRFDDKFVVVSNGIDKKAYALPAVEQGGKKFVCLDFRNPQIAMFFTGKGVSTRPFVNCTLKKVMTEAIHEAFKKIFDAEKAEEAPVEEGMEEEEGAEAEDASRTWRWRKAQSRKKNFALEINVPKSPESETSRKMLVIPTLMCIKVHGTAVNLDWLLGFIRAELELPSEPVRKRRLFLRRRAAVREQ